MRSTLRKVVVLFDESAINYIFLDDYSDIDSQPLSDPRTLDTGFVTLINAAQMSTDGTDLIGHENSAGNAGAAYSANDGSATTIADGQLFAVKKTSASGSSSLGAGFHSTTSQPVSYIGFNGIVTNFGVTLRSGSDFYNFASAIFGAGSTVAYWFDNNLCHVFTYNTTDLEPKWRLRFILPAISGGYYFNVQTCINQASGQNKIGRTAAADGLIDIIGGTSVGNTAGSTADAPNADFVARMVITTAPTASTFVFKFRIQNASNYWSVEVDGATGDIDLVETVAGSPTTRATSAAAVTNGEKVIISADDETIDVWANTTRISYSSAVNFKTEVACELDALGTGGVVAGIMLHRRVPTGQTLNKLNSVGGV